MRSWRPGSAAAPGSAFVADGGRARLVVAEPRGSAFTSDAARALVEDVERAEASARRPGVTAELTGGHAIAWATERMLKRDLEPQRNPVRRAGVAGLSWSRSDARAPSRPCCLRWRWGPSGRRGSLRSSRPGIHAVAIAFAAVVVGVGVDTGVHVYAALLDARRAGVPASKAAAAARRATWKPTLTAAVVASAAFASLGLSGLRAMRQLGLLCGAGEVLTAVAILLLTPEIGAWLERSAPPPSPPTPRWIEALAWATRTRRRALGVLAASAVPVVMVALVGWPRPADALVAVRPTTLEPLAVEERIHALFGGRPGQWIVLTTDADEERARTRADRVAEALEPMARRIGEVDGFDALATFAPSATTQRARFAERDALDLLPRVARLSPRRPCATPGFSAQRPSRRRSTPSRTLPQEVVAGDADGPLSWLFARHVAHAGNLTLVATYVRPTGDATHDARLRATILAADPGSAVTGFDAIDRALRGMLARDLVLVGGAALVLVAVAMRLALRSVRGAGVALATLACEMALVGVAMRVLGVGWHVYDALVLPVLFGVTIDESMFLLHAARQRPIADALRVQGPLVAATALTTAAGFAALVACRFDGLRDLGLVGTLGVLAGLVAALVVVPAALRVMESRGRGSSPAAGEHPLPGRATPRACPTDGEAWGCLPFWLRSPPSTCLPPPYSRPRDAPRATRRSDGVPCSVHPARPLWRQRAVAPSEKPFTSPRSSTAGR